MNQLAYLDPATGSLIAATAAGGLAGMGVAAKSMWHRRTARFRKDESDEATEEATVDITDEDVTDSEFDADPDAAESSVADSDPETGQEPELEEAGAGLDQASTNDH